MNNNNNRQKKKRAYIGNLRYRPDLPSRLHTELFLPNNLRVTNAQNGGIVVSRTGFNNNAFAFVEFNDVDYAIRTLDGARFDGRTLRVSKEKANIDFRNSGSTGGSFGFGSSRWAGDGGSSNDGQQRRAVQQKRMSEESSSILEDDALTPMNQHDIETNVNQEDTIVAGIKSVITTEFEEKTTNNITTAIMCTAAMTLLASMDAFGLAENDDDDVWYNKEKLYAVRVRKQSYRCTERCNLAMFLYNLNDIANGASFCIIMRYYSLRSQCESELEFYTQETYSRRSSISIAYLPCFHPFSLNLWRL